MRKTFTKWATRAAVHDKRIVILSADYGFKAFTDVPPEQFFNFGPMEQSMIGVSSGLAIAGKYPILYGITPFMLERSFEFLKLDLNYPKLPCMVVCYADYPTAGPTHWELDAPKMVGMLKSFRYYAPETLADAEAAFNEAYCKNDPAFIRLSDRGKNLERDSDGNLSCWG